jgi:Raf kinase inhibitor-like YbhB/YbcL family protein
LYDLPATVRNLPEAVENNEAVLHGAKQGINDFNRIGYGGPCPPAGNPHRYYFSLYVLDGELNLKSGATKNEVEAAMKGHILAQGKLMGTYKRK